mgnify:CR=1 FL=1
MQQFHPHPYQQAGIEAILEKSGVALWMEMGLGKTVVTLTAIDQLIYDRLEISRVLIIAPRKVAEATWQDEAAKWEHLRHLRLSTVLGSEKQRLAALAAPADIYIINRENTAWLVQTLGRKWDFDMVVLDEASSFKNHAAQRFKALKAVRPRIHKLVELTGTPSPNGLLDLWAQVWLLDQGQRLGRYITHYRQQYFWPTQYSYEPKAEAAEAIHTAIRDIVLSFKAADHLTLPEKIIDDIPVVLDKPAKAAYKKLEKDYLLDVDGETITAQQAAALTGKLLQLCNGSIYDESGTVHQIHRCKLDAFDELIDALDGQKALVFYGFRFDEEQLTETLKTRHRGLRFAVLRSGQDAADWNAGKLDVLLAQPASCAYGLNLQQGGHHLIWYSLPWSLELYAQGEARLYRQGQTQSLSHDLHGGGGADEAAGAAAGAGVLLGPVELCFVDLAALILCAVHTQLLQRQQLRACVHGAAGDHHRGDVHPGQAP